MLSAIIIIMSAVAISLFIDEQGGGEGGFFFTAGCLCGQRADVTTAALS